MLFNSLEFFVFFPIVFLVYFCVPKKIRYFWLLISSYYFYMCWDPQYIILLFSVTFLTYIGGIILDWCNKKYEEEEKKKKIKKLVMSVGITANLGILGYFKYSGFLMENISFLLGLCRIKVQSSNFNVLLPVGISFFTFQAVSYLIDVYREEIYVEKNFFRYALFVSFFPQLVAGPIERSKNLLKQLATPADFSYENIRKGFWIMIYGYFLKVVLADRIAIFVDMVYENTESFQGIYLIFAALLFSIQIYCDFYGYSMIALGAAKIMGYQLIDNFNAPFFSCTVEELWRRWHISLNTWFRDYLYFPLGGNRKGVVRQYVNKLVVFFVSGLWHGANWTFVIWGLLNGFYIFIGQWLKPIRNIGVKVLGLRREAFSHRLFQRIVTYALFSFSFIFFRAQSIEHAWRIIQGIVKVWNPWILFDGSLYNCGLDQKNFTVVLWGIGLLMTADWMKYHKISGHEFVMKQEGWFRVILAAGSILLILLLGIWGSGYDQAAFIYFQF